MAHKDEGYSMAGSTMNHEETQAGNPYKHVGRESWGKLDVGEMSDRYGSASNITSKSNSKKMDY